ncbi:cilia- and flagella-associated protein 221 isoform X2 [Pseudophryne corroboree]|uniref:cilia- and flagella-associated protein 221 isoform X2 n=1 Tax=Pseudophryne corroboree TaxID=495146 RepID=UPI003081F3D7
MEVAQPPAMDLKLGKQSPLFLDSLVREPQRRPVPNHLLESKIYAKLVRNGSVEAEPGVLHFGGYKIGKCHQQTLRLVNISTDVSNLHIIPPQSKHFTISYRKANRLVPGLAFTIHVRFIPDEWRYYYDCIRVHCKGDETLLVPLHAYPAINLTDFPSHVNLSDVALGQSARHVITLRCSCPIDFEFSIISTQSHKDFHTAPVSGIIPADGVIDVIVTYTPTSYGTAQISLELLISEFNAKPRRCVITGTCSPNLAATDTQKESSEKVLAFSKERPKDLEKVTFGVSRKKRHLKTLQQNASQVIEYHDLKFPVNLSNPHSVATVLNQQPGKLSVKDLRDGLTFPSIVKGRQEKERLFQQLVQHNVTEEETNQLRWQVHLGSGPISPKQRKRITDDRQRAEAEYQVKRGRTDLGREYKRETLSAVSQRVLRTVAQGPTFQPQFDLYLNDLWANRNQALRCFQQAARKVLIQCRVNLRLLSLRKLLEGRSSVPEGDPVFDSSDEEMIHMFPFSTDQILFYEFPPYPAEPDGSVPGDVGSGPPKPAAVQLKQRFPFYDLQVPQHFKLMGYQPVSFHGESSTYQTRHLARPLRRGAEDELTPDMASQIDVPGSAASHRPSIHFQGDQEKGTLTLTPPEQLLNPPDFHPLHVFNPAPGLLAFKTPLSYSETDIEYHLCPLPKYPIQSETAGNTQRKFLSRQEIIKGLMTWKKFPSSSLSVPLPGPGAHSPRWCDPFNADLLPLNTPPKLRDLPEEEKENLVVREGDGADSAVSLTPGMVRAEFAHNEGDKISPSEKLTESPVPAEGNTLADKVLGHLEQMKLLLHNKKLILN